jgi:hypothetical protein
MHQRGPLPDQGAAIPREVAQRALGHGWNTAGAPHPMLQKLGQPGGSFDVRLASRSQVDVLRMDSQDLTRPFEPIEHGFPISAGTLHRDMRAAARQQPIGEPSQLNRHRAQGAYLLPSWGHHPGHHRLLVHIQAGAPLVHDLHSHLRAKGERLAWRPESSDPDVRAPWQQLAVSAGTPGPTGGQAQGHHGIKRPRGQPHGWSYPTCSCVVVTTGHDDWWGIQNPDSFVEVSRINSGS